MKYSDENLTCELDKFCKRECRFDFDFAQFRSEFFLFKTSLSNELADLKEKIFSHKTLYDKFDSSRVYLIAQILSLYFFLIFHVPELHKLVLNSGLDTSFKLFLIHLLDFAAFWSFALLINVQVFSFYYLSSLYRSLKILKK